MKRKICVIAEPLSSLHTETIQLCEALGEALARSNRLVVCAGFDTGLLSFFAKSFLLNSGHLTSIYCNQLSPYVTLIENANTIQIVDDFDEQKKELIDYSDAFIVLPNPSLYSMQFITDILFRNSIELIRKPIVIFDQQENFEQILTYLNSIAAKNDSDFPLNNFFLNEFNPWALINKLDNPAYSFSIEGKIFPQ